ncbi:MAG TPA: WYL domain-containing protein [Actinomycetota bacterium]
MPDATRTSPPKIAERLGRMLVIVPYLVRHPGSALDEVATLFDVKTDQLRRDLDLLFMSGLPPYGPGDLIDVDVDEDERIWITMADHFSRPLRLSRQEALAITLRCTELLATPGLPEAPSLESAVHKLREALGPDTAGDERSIGAAESGRPAEHLETLRHAAAERERLEIEYFAGSTGAWSMRDIEPEEVFSAMGNWYVAAWDVEADDERLFRADRIKAVRATGIHFQPRGLEGAGRALYTPTGDEVPVRLSLGPEARWIAEYYVTEGPIERDDGTLEVTLPAAQLAWVTRLLLRTGPEARALAPPELQAAVVELADETLAHYR